MPSFAPGEKLGPYEILSPLGAGGMGKVYKARDTRLDRIVAIKTSEAKFSDRFEREARAVAALNHLHICQLYDVGPDYLVMEYVEGMPLNGSAAATAGSLICGAVVRRPGCPRTARASCIATSSPETSWWANRESKLSISAWRRWSARKLKQQA